MKGLGIVRKVVKEMVKMMTTTAARDDDDAIGETTTETTEMMEMMMMMSDVMVKVSEVFWYMFEDMGVLCWCV